jgi:hypothetical protein
MSNGQCDAPQGSVEIKGVTCYGKFDPEEDFFVLGEYPEDHPRFPGETVEFLWGDCTDFSNWTQAVKAVIGSALGDGYEVYELAAS